MREEEGGGWGQHRTSTTCVSGCGSGPHGEHESEAAERGEELIPCIQELQGTAGLKRRGREEEEKDRRKCVGCEGEDMMRTVTACMVPYLSECLVRL